LRVEWTAIFAVHFYLWRGVAVLAVGGVFLEPADGGDCGDDNGDSEALGCVEGFAEEYGGEAGGEDRDEREELRGGGGAEDADGAEIEDEGDGEEEYSRDAGDGPDLPGCMGWGVVG